MTSGEVRETFRALVLPDLRDWLRQHRTGPDTYPWADYARYVAETADAYLQGWGCGLPLTPGALAMLDGIHDAARDAADEVGGWEPLDGYSRAIAAKYAAH